MTDFGPLPEHKDAGTDAGAPLHGPGGLLATPGLSGRKARKGRKWGMRLKDGYGARAGETIRGNLGRSTSGQFQRVGAANPDAPPRIGHGAAKKPRGRKGSAKPKQTPEQRAQTSAQKRTDNLNAVGDQLDASDTLAGIDAYDKGQLLDPAIQKDIIAAGLGELGRDGALRLTASGREAMHAAQRGDVGAARDAMSRGRDQKVSGDERAIAHTTRQQATAARRAEVAARRAAKLSSKRQPKQSGGGDIASAMQGLAGQATAPKRKKKGPSAITRARTAENARNANLAKNIPRLSPTAQRALGAPAKDRQPTPAAAPSKARTKAQTDQERAMFANMGGGGSGGSGGKAGGGSGGALWSKGPGGKRTPTKADAQSALRSYRARSDQAKAKKRDAIQLDAHASMAKRKGDTAEADRLSTQAKKLHDEARALDLHKKAIPELRVIDRAGYHMSGDGSRLVPSKTSTTPKMKEASFIVYKDAAGHDRWIARTTTAYKDRDNEIISEAALDQDSQRMMVTKAFGPLRWWHVGDPDPLLDVAPWGPGLDIGDCDYSTVIGRTRVESGTFRDPGIARKVAMAADRLEMSPGFSHPLDQPDRAGVFHTIRTFERSVVPVRYGRASNLFTGFTVKEFRMDVAEMEKRFKAMYSELGLTPEQGAALGGQLVATEKAAAQQGITYKSDEQPATGDVRAAMGTPQPVYVAADGTSGIIVNGMFSALALKAAPPPPPMADMAAPDAETPEEDVAEGGVEEPGEDMQGDYIGDMSWDEFAAKLSELLAPVLKMQDMHKGMMDAMGEMKTMYGGVATKDDARSAELIALKAQYTELAAKIATIEGDQPNTILPDEVAAALKSAGPAKPAVPENPVLQEALNDPKRPFAWLGMQTFPELYNQNGENG